MGIIDRWNKDVDIYNNGASFIIHDSQCESCIFI